MKGLPQSTVRQKQPTNPGNTVSSPVTLSKRTGHIFPGALLFIALAAVVSYGAANTPVKQTTSSNESINQRSTTELSPNIAATTQVIDPVTNELSKETTMDTNSSSSHSGVSTRITNDNGNATVTINGNKVVTPEQGSVSKTITTDDGNVVEINVNQKNSSDTDVRVRSSNSSSYDTRSETETEVRR